jgi:hypothetical protein|tara:strand:- start:225 stop:2045 length:1821 start_codon:yes stop_codon:yes gene_type:complete
MIEQKQPKILYDAETDYLLNTNIKPDNQYRQEYDQSKSFAAKTGDFFKYALSIPEKLDKAIGIHGTRQAAIKALTGGLSEDHMVAALAGEMLVPDSLDLITLGLGYLPRRVMGGGSKAIKMYLKAKKAKIPKRIIEEANSISRGTKRITDADYEEMIKGADKVGRITGKSTDKVLTEQGLLSKMDFQDLDEAEAAASQASALDILRKQRDAGKGTDEAARAQSHIDILKANRTVMGDGSKHIPTLKDKGISEEANAVFSRAAFRGGVFDYEKWFLSKDRRITEFFGSIGKRYSKGNYNKVKELLQPIMESEFADFFAKYDIPGHRLELHHITPLNIGAQLFDGLKWQSDEWYDLMEVFYKKGVFPGANQVTGTITDQLTAGNLTEVMKEAHYVLHQKYFKDVLGVFDPKKSRDPYAHFTKFFTPARNAKIKSGEAGRKAVAAEYADRLKEGEVLVKRMMGQIQQAVGKSPLSTDPIENFDELADLFFHMNKDGTLPALTSKFTGKSYSSKIVNDQIAEIAKDILMHQRLRKTFGPVLRMSVRLSKPQEKIIFSPMFARFSRDMMYSNLTPKQLKAKYKGGLDQMEFIFESLDDTGLIDSLKNMPKP